MRLPLGLGPRQLVVLGVVAGMSFTVAPFIAQLAFAHPRLLDAANVGVHGASALAGLGGVALGRAQLRPEPEPEAALTADEAEGPPRPDPSARATSQRRSSRASRPAGT